MDERLDFTAGPGEADERLDKCVKRYAGDDYSREQLKNLILSGDVTVNSRKVKPGYIVKTGDFVAIRIPPRKAHCLEPEDIRIDVLHEDEHIIVVDKPAGMVVHPGAGNIKGTLVAALLCRLGDLPEAAGSPLRPGMVHRLDKDTSGVMVVAKTDKAMRSLAKQFQARTVKKTYIAVVNGNVELDNGIVDAPLARQKTDRKKMGVEHSDGKSARTVYHVLERFGDFTLVRLDLFTGRTHQIRVHMEHLGHPVAGDRAYGGGGDIARQALHAEMLGFTHPGTAEDVRFFSPLPDDIACFIEQTRKKE